MQPDAYRWVQRCVELHGPFSRVCEFGSRNINGGVRDLFGAALFVGIDLVAGNGVDVVADASLLELGDGQEPFDCVVCCETFEHTQSWPAMVATAGRILGPGGALIVTAAGPGWPEHSAVDGGDLLAGEWYENVDPERLGLVMTECGFVDIAVDRLGCGVRSVGVKGLTGA